MMRKDRYDSAVLVFEPVSDLKPFFARQLELAEVDAYYATSLNEARMLLKREPEIALALVDLSSAHEGLLLIREIYEDFPFVQSIAVVPDGQIKLLRQGMNRGAADFLVAPISEQNFQEVLSNTMVTVRARREILRTRKRYAAVRKDLEIAGKIQHSMLPPPALDHDRINLHAALIPAADIGGDFFDYFFIGQNKMVFLIGDVSGKGVPAALFMAVSRSLLRSNGLQRLAPAECLERTNYMLCQNNDAGMFVTVFYGVIDLETGVLTYVNAGHNPPYLIHAQEEVNILEKTGDMALGIFDDNMYSQQTVQLRSGDMVYLYTDGIVEAVDEDYQLYGNERLQQILHSGIRYNCRKVIEHGLTSLRKFTGGMDQSDDITSMVLELL